LKQQEVIEIYEETVPYLLQWYDYNRRILPWREDPTPYHVWVSEIMLQQTRVEAVKGYYDRFLTCLPNIASLAAAEEEVLLKLWEGLGYYNRVRNMQKAAKILVEQYGGEMPADYDKIRALPGIGDYTAGAISSIAFGMRYPAVDGNVLRVMSRIVCNEEDITKESTKRKLKEDLTNVIPERSGDFNQSLMELGATVCLPNGKPLCDKCPVMHLCKAFHEGKETVLPVKSGTKARRVEKRVVYVISYGERILLHRRAKKGLLAGLWEFPNVLTEGKGLAPARLSEMLKDLNGNDADFKIKKGKKAKHIFSHVEWHMEGIEIETKKTEGNIPERLTELIGHLTGEDRTPEDWVFATRQEMRETYPIPSAFEAYVKKILQ